MNGDESAVEILGESVKINSETDLRRIHVSGWPRAVSFSGGVRDDLEACRGASWLLN